MPFAFARLSTVQHRRMGDVLAFPIRTCLLPWPWMEFEFGETAHNRFLCQAHPYCPYWPASKVITLAAKECRYFPNACCAFNVHKSMILQVVLYLMLLRNQTCRSVSSAWSCWRPGSKQTREMSTEANQCRRLKRQLKSRSRTNRKA